MMESQRRARLLGATLITTAALATTPVSAQEIADTVYTGVRS